MFAKSALPLLAASLLTAHAETILNDNFDSYPPNTVNEAGPEFVYVFTVDEEVRFSAAIDAPEPDGSVSLRPSTPDVVPYKGVGTP